MNALLKILSVLLLLFNTIGAVYGGLHLILHPDGSSIGLSLDWLKHSPFDSYLIPGFVLLLANGLFGLFVLWQVLSGRKSAAFYVLIQGCLLTGWILIQILMLQSVYFLHYISGSVGLVLIISGFLMWRIGNPSNSTSS